MTEFFWFVITAMLVITVHEAGHLFAALWSGIEVKRFSIGFGKPLWLKSISIRSQRRPLELALAPIPLGGYVAFQSAEDGQKDGFEHASIAARLVTILSGPLANVLLSLFIWFSIGLFGQTVLVARLAQPVPDGVAHQSGLRSGDLIKSISSGDGSLVRVHGFEHLMEELQKGLNERQVLTLELDRNGHSMELVLDLTEEGLPGRSPNLSQLGVSGVWVAPVITKVISGGVAEQAGLRPGDRVLSVNNQPIDDALSLKRLIWGSAKQFPVQSQNWMVQRDGQSLNFSIKPERVIVDGNPQGRVQILIGSAPEYATIQLSLSEAISAGLNRFWTMTVEMLSALSNAFDSNPSNSVQIVGPVGLAQLATASASSGVQSWLLFVASLSLSLAWLNLLPVPVLDGGQAVFLGVEALVGKNRADQIRLRMNRVGVFLLLGLMAWAIYNDLVRVFSDSVISR